MKTFLPETPTKNNTFNSTRVPFPSSKYLYKFPKL